eukprot:gene2235-2949_t
MPYDTTHDDDPYWAPPLKVFPRRVSDPVVRPKPTSYCPESLHALPDSESSLAETELSYDAPSIVESFEKSFASSESVSELDEPEAAMFGHRRDPLPIATAGPCPRAQYGSSSLRCSAHGLAGPLPSTAVSMCRMDSFLSHEVSTCRAGGIVRVVDGALHLLLMNLPG